MNLIAWVLFALLLVKNIHADLGLTIISVHIKRMICNKSSIACRISGMLLKHMCTFDGEKLPTDP